MKIHAVEEKKRNIFFYFDESEFYEIINNHLSHIEKKECGKYANMAVITLKNEEEFEETLKILSKIEKNKKE